jgi:hypothetical protein
VVKLVVGQIIEEDSVSHCRLDMPMQRPVIFEDLTATTAGVKGHHELSPSDEPAAKKRRLDGPATKTSRSSNPSPTELSRPVDASTYDKVHVVVICQGLLRWQGGQRTIWLRVCV